MSFHLLTFITIVYSMGNGELIVDFNIRWFHQNQSKCDLTSNPQCSSDCSSILVCVTGNETPAESIKCQPDTPYCDRGTCTSTPGSCTSYAKTSNFLCTSTGVFPDPTDCTKYHSCTKSGSMSTKHECPGDGSVYNSKLKMCQTGQTTKFGHFFSRKSCDKINCDNKENEFVIYAANPAFYAFCSVTNCNVKQTFMYKCDNEETHIFDVQTRTCIFNCQSAGYFADSFNCSVYHICNGKRVFTSQRVHCPPGYYFNGTACVNSSKHCPSGSVNSTVITTTTTSAESLMHAMTDSTTENLINSSTTPAPTSQLSTQTSTNLPATQSSADPTSMPLPNFRAPYPSILFLPCPLYLTISNDQICSEIGSYLTHTKVQD